LRALYLLDTSILSQLAPGRGSVPEHAVAWLKEREDHSYISVISVLELERGIAKLVRQGESEKAQAVSIWVENLLGHYSSRVVEIDQAVAQCAGRLEDIAIGKGLAPTLADTLIGASALLHGGMVVTRNLVPFQNLGVEATDPFSAAA
jgi:predicted nucleic acid-binding protein